MIISKKKPIEMKPHKGDLVVKSERRVRRGCPSTVRHANQNTNSKEKYRHDNYLESSQYIVWVFSTFYPTATKLIEISSNISPLEPSRRINTKAWRLYIHISLPPFHLPAIKEVLMFDNHEPPFSQRTSSVCPMASI